MHSDVLPPAANRLRPIALTDLPAGTPALTALPVSQESAATPCPICQGAGWFTRSVPYGHPEFATLVPCACQDAERTRRGIADLVRLSSLNALRDKTFARFQPLEPGIQHAYQRALAYTRQPRGWLSLFGPYGCGKTHLAAAVANTLIDYQVPVVFAVVPDLLDHLRSTFAPDSPVSYDQRFDAVRSAPLLVLDDLGTESGSAWAREKLYQIVNARYNDRLPTIITSNVRLEQIDPRIASRMHDPALPGEVITINAGDYRRRTGGQ